MNHIEVVLTLTSPMHVAYPENRVNNVSLTTKQGVFLDGQMRQLPIYPANGFRGGLRRKAAARVMQHLVATEGAIPGNLYIGLTCGASSASPDSTPVSIEEIIRVRGAAYTGLFGGGGRIHRSMYRVSDMMPIIEETLVTGMVPASCAELVQPKPSYNGEPGKHIRAYELCGERTSIRVDDLFRVMRPDEIQSCVADPIQTVSHHQQQVSGNNQDRKEAKDSGEKVTKTDSANMMTYETVSAGVPFYFRIDLDRDMPAATLGLLLLSLSDLFVENAFGGWVRCGMGKVSVKSMKVNFNDCDYVWQDFYGQDGVFTLPAEAASLIDAAKEAIALTTTAQLADFFADFSAGKKQEKLDKAKQKKAA